MLKVVCKIVCKVVFALVWRCVRDSPVNVIVC